MAATYSRHSPNYATPAKMLPITVSSKAPAYNYPVSRVAVDLPEYSDTSTTYSSGRHSGGTYSARSSNYAPSHSSGDYENYRDSGVDVVDMLSERMNSAFDPIRMDRSIVRQAQTSGQLNAKQRELEELQALAKRRLKTARVNFAEGIDAAREARRDLDYTSKKISSIKSKAERKHPDAYEKARRSRHAA